MLGAPHPCLGAVYKSSSMGLQIRQSPRESFSLQEPVDLIYCWDQTSFMLLSLSKSAFFCPKILMIFLGDFSGTLSITHGTDVNIARNSIFPKIFCPKFP